MNKKRGSPQVSSLKITVCKSSPRKLGLGDTFNAIFEVRLSHVVGRSERVTLPLITEAEGILRRILLCLYLFTLYIFISLLRALGGGARGKAVTREEWNREKGEKVSKRNVSNIRLFKLCREVEEKDEKILKYRVDKN